MASMTTSGCTNGHRSAKHDFIIPDFGEMWKPQVQVLTCGIGVADVELTPELAEKFLDNLADDQRNLRHSLIERLVSDLQNDRYRMTHQGMAFNRFGRFCDGQNRCEALIRSGIESMRTLVFFGVGGKEEMSVMDTGAIRTAQDAAKVLGMKTSGWWTSITRQYIYWHKSAIARPRVISNPETLSAMERIREQIMTVDSWYPAKPPRGTDRAAVACAILAALIHGHDKEHLRRFVGILCDTIPPTDSPADSGPRKLRRYCEENTRGKGGYTADIDFYLRTCNAILLSRADKEVKQLHAIATNPFICETSLFV